MKFKMLVCAVILGALALGGVISAPAQKKAHPPAQVLGDDDVAKKGKARIEAAQKAYLAWFRTQHDDLRFSDTLYQLSVKWLNAELELATEKQARTDAFKGHLDRINACEKLWKGIVAEPALAIMLSYKTEAEYWLAKEQSSTR